MEIKTVSHPTYAGHRHDKEGNLVESASGGDPFDAHYLICVCPNCGKPNTLACVINGEVHMSAKPICTTPDCGTYVGDTLMPTKLCTLQERDEWIGRMKQEPKRAKPKKSAPKEEFVVPDNFDPEEVETHTDAEVEAFVPGSGGASGEGEL